jgi:hypothetical protein
VENERPRSIKERNSQEHTQQTPLSTKIFLKKAGQTPYFVIEHIPELLGNMFTPWGQAAGY